MNFLEELPYRLPGGMTKDGG